MPLAIATIGDLVPPSDRGRWQGLTGAVFGVASILGPTTGGYIADNADWRWVFLVSLPVALIALVVVATTLKIPPHPERGDEDRLHGRGAARRRPLDARCSATRARRPGGAVGLGRRCSA